MAYRLAGNSGIERFFCAGGHKTSGMCVRRGKTLLPKESSQEERPRFGACFCFKKTASYFFFAGKNPQGIAKTAMGNFKSLNQHHLF
ncbi:MAG TPA: hypothetical protein PKL15_01730 [Saprospiraceae bacterium]|nr:hypothetical protein [Saprospiraceae bacterium]HNL38765.1 hypothetical protein [Saprospiraceae bacterium]HNM24112.1 hypothetical protein [Saprospiraceae bacterium]